MIRVHKALLGWAFAACCGWLPARAEDFQFVPEIDAYLRLDSVVRVYFQAKDDRDAGDPLQSAVGPSVQLYLKPLVKLKRVTVFDLDDSKSRMLVMETGYRYVTSPGAPTLNRWQSALTFNFPLQGGFLISDRNRADLDWQGGGFLWRYRNKVSLQRTVSIRSYHFSPYVAVEPYYLSQYHKVSTTDLYAGCVFPLGRHIQFDPYYEHENDTGKKRNQQKEDFGLALHLFIRPEKK